MLYWSASAYPRRDSQRYEATYTPRRRVAMTRSFLCRRIREPLSQSQRILPHRHPLVNELYVVPPSDNQSAGKEVHLPCGWAAQARQGLAPVGVENELGVILR